MIRPSIKKRHDTSDSITKTILLVQMPQDLHAVFLDEVESLNSKQALPRFRSHLVSVHSTDQAARQTLVKVLRSQAVQTFSGHVAIISLDCTRPCPPVEESVIQHSLRDRWQQMYAEQRADRKVSGVSLRPFSADLRDTEVNGGGCGDDEIVGCGEFAVGGVQVLLDYGHEAEGVDEEARVVELALAEAFEQVVGPAVEGGEVAGVGELQLRGAAGDDDPQQVVFVGQRDAVDSAGAAVEGVETGHGESFVQRSGTVGMCRLASVSSVDDIGLGDPLGELRG